MHEVGIIQNTLEAALKTAQASGAQRIHNVRMRVGRMSGVVPEALHFAFEVARQGTLAAQAELIIESVPVTCWCDPCQLEFEDGDLLYECPRCRQVSTELRRGHELELTSVEIS